MTHCHENEYGEPKEQKEGEVAKNEPTRRICSAHQREDLGKWQEIEERTIRWECIKGEVVREIDGGRKRPGPVQHKVAPNIGKGGLHSQATMMQYGSSSPSTAAKREGDGKLQIACQDNLVQGRSIIW